MRSNWVLYELGAAWALGTPIVAVLTDPAVRSKVPIEAHQLSVVHVADPKEPEAVDRILKKLRPDGQWHP